LLKEVIQALQDAAGVSAFVVVDLKAQVSDVVEELGYDVFDVV
jgi:hypothetical protein